MGISYDPSSKKWNVVYEKTDYKTDYPINTDNIETNNQNASLNAENAKLNEENTYTNQAYDKTIAVVSTTKGGDYTVQREIIRNIPSISRRLEFNLESYYRAFYLNEKLQRWDPSLGANPPYGEFDPSYYKTQSRAAAEQWANADARDDIDITERYGEGGFYLQHYTTQGKPAGIRGNKAEATAAADRYIEQAPTDADLQAVRTFQLGVDDRNGITELGDTIKGAVGERALGDVKRFGALRQDVLKQTIDEMKKVKAREQNMAVFKGFGAFSEITDINKELSNSILGDSGVGGVLSFMGGDKTQESLDKSLTKVTGVNTNNTVYNWQKWFDETLGTKEKDGFANEFTTKYLTPRFNTSRSMNEFVEYLDVNETEQNPFQTQDILNAAKLVADVRAKYYLDQLKATPGRYFDSDFYFTPTGDNARKKEYEEQASTVAADWEAAKNGDAYWKTQAYRFGVDLKDKNAFARVHFQVKGQGKGYDSAEDILNAGKVSDYIYTKILPAVKEQISKTGSVFGQFITPDEFADEMLEGLDPNNKSTWDKVLKRYGLDDFKGNLDELKEYVKNTLSTGSAQEIRENIKYLNEKRQKPTQEKLGITYIERAEDYKTEGIKGETELYRTFQSAGFKGTEDEFYNDFFPDMDRSEQVLLTKSGKGESLKTSKLDFTDPFASLGTIESFFDADEPEETTDKPEPKTNSYFRIAMGEDEDEPTTKSKSGESILGEFTSMFKGL